MAPGVLTQLEVCHANWDLKRYLAGRKFFRLNLKSGLKRVLPQALVSKSLAAVREVRMVSKSVIERYETRAERHTSAPPGQNPLFALDTWSPELRGQWVEKCSLFEWLCAVFEKRGAVRRWCSPPRIVQFLPYLNFSATEAKNIGHYESACRLALLAYVAFPNSVWRTSAELMLLPWPQCVSLFASFASKNLRESLPEPLSQWGDCPEFIQPQWVAAKKREDKADKANAHAIGPRPPALNSLSTRVVAWDIPMCERFPEMRVRGVARDLRSQGKPGVVLLYGVTPSSWGALQESYGRSSLGLTPAIPLPAEFASAHLFLTRFNVVHTVRDPPDGQTQLSFIQEATISCPVGGDVTFAAPSVGYSDGSDCAVRSAQLLEWLGRGPRRICVVDFGIDWDDSTTDNFAGSHPGCVDVWGKLLPGDPGYTYDGKRNMCAEANIRRRQFRIFRTVDLLPFASRISTVGASPIKGAKATIRGGLEAHNLHPSPRYGLSADFVFGGGPPCPSSRGAIAIPLSGPM